MNTNELFRIVTREPGTVRTDLPVWAARQSNPFRLSESRSNESVSRVEVPSVPGAFQLLNMLSSDEVERMIAMTEELGYTDDAAVSLPKEIRHNSNLTWIADDETSRIIWERSKAHFVDRYSHFEHKQPLGINNRFRFYRYEVGDYFDMHTDGSWPGSRIIDDKLVDDAYGDRWSMYTFLILLNDDFDGGETQFLIDTADSSRPARDRRAAETKSVTTPAGGVLCFPHGLHPYHCLHGSARIESGTKYIIRTDVLFEL